MIITTEPNDYPDADLHEVISRHDSAVSAMGKLARALDTIPLLYAEVGRLRARLIRTLTDLHNLIAAARATLGAHADGEGGPGGGDQVMQIGQGTGQPGAEPADLGAQERNRVQRPGELAHSRNGVLMSARYLLKISVREVVRFGRVDHLLYPWPVRARMMAVMVVRISGARVLVAR